METRERNSLNYNNPPQESNQESSSRSSTAPLISSPTSNNETPDQPPHLHLHPGNHYHGFKLQKEKPEAQRPGRNPNPGPDPSRPVSQPPSSQPLPPSTVARAAAATVVVRYRECLKNHAVKMGTHILDGCGEFMPSGEDDTREALKCAACECHRSFHRREVEGESQSGYYNYTQHTASQTPLSTRNHPPPPRPAAVPLPPPQPAQQRRHHHRHHQAVQPIMMAFGGASGTAAESSSEDLNMQLMGQMSKKRFRTKFTEEQKDKMQDFAERIGWKIQKQDEQEVLRFCNEVGLKRQVFKVWMHNNKQASKKNQM